MRAPKAPNVLFEYFAFSLQYSPNTLRRFDRIHKIRSEIKCERIPSNIHSREISRGQMSHIRTSPPLHWHVCVHTSTHIALGRTQEAPHRHRRAHTKPAHLRDNGTGRVGVRTIACSAHNAFVIAKHDRALQRICDAPPHLISPNWGQL